MAKDKVEERTKEAFQPDNDEPTYLVHEEEEKDENDDTTAVVDEAAEDDDEGEETSSEEEKDGDDDEESDRFVKLEAALQEERRARQEIEQTLQVVQAVSEAEPPAALEFDFGELDDADEVSVADVRKNLTKLNDANLGNLTALTYSVAELLAIVKSGSPETIERFNAIAGPVMKKAQTDKRLHQRLFSSANPFEAAFQIGLADEGENPKAKETKARAAKAKTLPRRVKGSKKSLEAPLTAMTADALSQLDDEQQAALIIHGKR